MEMPVDWLGLVNQPMTEKRATLVPPQSAATR